MAGSPAEIAVVEDGRLVEYFSGEAEEDSADSILLGRVDRIVPGMGAAFVDIGEEKNGFLPIEERTQTGDFPKLQTGMRVPVQVKREATGTKGAMLTRDLSLCGETVLLMPLNRYVGVSARVKSEGARRRLKEAGEAIASGRFGLVMRHAAEAARPEDIAAEAEALYRRWEEIRALLAVAHAPSVVYRHRTILDVLLDDYLPRGGTRVLTDDPATAERLQGRCEVSLTDSVDKADLRAERDKAFQRRVWLKSGGNLVIDQCEALTVIDVNTAKFTGQKQPEETIRRTNLEACREIARQARLRNLSGILLIDLIDMTDEKHREEVLAALNEAFAGDRIKTVVHGFTALNLVEMTRRRARRPLRERFAHPCPHCGGTGWVRDGKEQD